LKTIFEKGNPEEQKRTITNFDDECQKNIIEKEKEFDKSNEQLQTRKERLYAKTVEMLDQKLKFLTSIGYEGDEIDRVKTLLQETKDNSDLNTSAMQDLSNLENAVEVIFIAHKLESKYYDRTKEELEDCKNKYEQSEKKIQKLKIDLDRMKEERDRLLKIANFFIQPCSKCGQPKILQCSSTCQ